MTAILVCTAMLAMLLANMCLGLSNGRVFGRGGMVTRDRDPLRFWEAVLFSGVSAALFITVLLALLGFRPALQILHVVPCKGGEVGCIEQ